VVHCRHATVLLVVCAAACAPRHPAAVDLAAELMAVWESGQTQDDDFPNSTAYHGIAEVRQYVEHVHGWARDIRFRLSRIEGTDTSAVAEWVMNAVQDRPIGKRVPVATMRPVEIHGVTLVSARGGRIVRAADYLDALGFVLQLGSRVELPGGTVLELPR